MRRSANALGGSTANNLKPARRDMEASTVAMLAVAGLQEIKGFQKPPCTGEVIHEMGQRAWGRDPTQSRERIVLVPGSGLLAHADRYAEKHGITGSRGARPIGVWKSTRAAFGR